METRMVLTGLPRDHCMWQKNINDFDRVVAIGGGHGMGRVLSSLSFLGSRLTGIVTTTDDGGSTGRLRKARVHRLGICATASTSW